ncbi:MAG TPA: hypothetical protein VHK28_07230, partial [Candidatus Limnocylindria bacterium]|nr:hypothetical protein [Candidatus Limnocylindria bacterium]
MIWVDDEQYGSGPDGEFIAGVTEIVPLAVLDTPQGTRIKFLGAPTEEAIAVPAHLDHADRFF